MTDRYAVFGHPIAHSKSPLIHAAFARQTGQDMTYEAILAPLDGFADSVAAFVAAGGRGANVTVPFKEAAFKMAQRLSPRAERAGAVNTLSFDADGILGDNTDGAGLVADLTRNLKRTLAGKRILLLGAGGAARGVIEPLLDQQPAALVIANRTLSRAEELAALFGRGIRASTFEAADTPLRCRHQRHRRQSGGRTAAAVAARFRRRHAGLRHDVRPRHALPRFRARPRRRHRRRPRHAGRTGGRSVLSVARRAARYRAGHREPAPTA